MSAVAMPKRQSRIAEFLTPPQLDRLLAAIEADAELKCMANEATVHQIRWLKDAIVLAVNTGLRRGELVNLQWQGVDFDSGFLTTQLHSDYVTKSGHERSVPLSPDARSILERLAKEQGYPQEGPVLRGVGGLRLNAEYLSKRFKYYVRVAKLPERIRFHSLRHTCASWLVQRGVSLPIVQAILGHSDIHVTQRYAHLAPDVMKAAIEQAFGSGENI